MLVQGLLEKSAKRLSRKTALVCGANRLSYETINDMADRLAVYLHSVGVGRQDKVCVLLDNSVESVVSIFGVLKAGAVFSVLSPTMKSKKLRFILNDLGAKVLISGTNKRRVVEGALTDAKTLQAIVWCNGKNGETARERVPSFNGLQSTPWQSVMDANPTLSSAPLPSSIDVDLATIIYTSGSTGQPRGVMSTHYNMIAAARSITQYLENREDDIILNALPLSFDYGLYQVLMAFMAGATLVLERTFTYPYKIIERLSEEKCTGFPIVPTMAAHLFKMDDLSNFDFRSLRYISSTASTLTIQHIETLQRHFPEAKIYSMYGLTECKRVSYLPPEYLATKPKSVGIPMPNLEVFVLNEEGKEVDAGEIGELVVRGSTVMQGYWNDEAETRRVFRAGRYRGDVLLFTGDLFRRDSEGFLFFVSRRDGQIKKNGLRISPKEIEDVLCEINGVIEAAVVGLPDEAVGELIKACVHVHNGKYLSERDILDYCNKNLESFMVPDAVEFQKNLPKLANGKIDTSSLNGGLPEPEAQCPAA